MLRFSGRDNFLWKPSKMGKEDTNGNIGFNANANAGKLIIKVFLERHILR